MHYLRVVQSLEISDDILLYIQQIYAINEQRIAGSD
jgi:hypothetical protein